jgi:thymidine kinase
MSEQGYLELTLGPMFSGKTSHLITLYKQYKLSGMSVCVVNYSEDTRYSEHDLVSHDGQKIECTKSLELKNIPLDYNVYLVNEAQFFGDLVETVKNWVEIHKKIVHCSGLDGDYKRRPFGHILELIPLADTINKTHAICMGCRNGTPAIFTKRLIESDDIKVIGGSESYMPVCRNCYMN